jgi:hypothetical protein
VFGDVPPVILSRSELLRPNFSSRWAFASSATLAVRNRRFVELDSPLDSPLG